MPEMIEDFMSPDNTQGRFDSPSSFLFNEDTKPYNLKLLKGKKYLLRIVNMGAVACGAFHIDNYTLSVVEIDGVQMVPKDTDRIILCAGQSYGVVVKGQDDPKYTSKWYAEMETEMFTKDPPPKEETYVSGKLSYDMMDDMKSSMQEMKEDMKDMYSMVGRAALATLDDFTMKPLDGQQLLGPAENRIDFTFNQTYFNGVGSRAPMNAEPWVPPKVPTLYTAMTTRSKDPATYGPGVNPWIVKYGEVVQIHMNNPHPYPHPMHLHGHVFQIVAKGSGTWNGDESGFPQVPTKRDGVLVPANGHAVIRFKADNPGVWFFHCHVDFHLVGGMAATIIEAPDRLRGSVPAAGKALCDAGGFKSSGNCLGQPGKITAAEASKSCNNVFNTKVRGAKIVY